MKVSHYRDTKPEQELPGVAVRDVITAETGAPNFMMRVFEVEPGSATRVHDHWWEHEIFVLSGRGTIVGENKEIEIGEGTIIFTAPYEFHGFVNKGSEPLRYVLLNPLEHLKPKE
jgi:quercetin dioxygenase-like cupin family protein